MAKPEPASQYEPLISWRQWVSDFFRKVFCDFVCFFFCFECCQFDSRCPTGAQLAVWNAIVGKIISYSFISQISPSTKAQNAAISINHQNIGNFLWITTSPIPMGTPPPPFWDKAWTYSQPRKPFNCFWMTKIDHRITDRSTGYPSRLPFLQYCMTRR